MGEIAKLVQPFDPSNPYALEFISGDIGMSLNRPQPLGNGYVMASDKRNIIIFNKDGQYKIVGRLPDDSKRIRP